MDLLVFGWGVCVGLVLGYVASAVWPIREGED